MPWLIRLLRGIEFSLYAIFFAGLLGGSSLLISTKSFDLARRFTRSVEFDYISWTLDAMLVKLEQSALDTPYYFRAPARNKIVADYLRLMDEILTHETRVNLIYADPEIKDPAAASSDQRIALEHMYASQRKLAPLAEAVLQEQISATLASLDLTTGGQPIPPVLFHISHLPYDLVISPRGKIQQDATISLVPDLSVAQQTRLESIVDSGMDVSSLVVPVGGIGSYPTMVMRTTDLNWLSDTIAHEWTHNWLSLRPLGLNYETTPELRTMNETTASIAGREIAALVLEKYYPAMAVMDNIQPINLTNRFEKTDFNFNAEMHLTRVRVDDLLAQGRISEAETYMEQRRLFFWQNGFPIRKLNQAYFAFYGAYAETPGGPAGEDPVGPAVRALRAQSGSLTKFLKTISQMDSFQQLLAAINP